MKAGGFDDVDADGSLYLIPSFSSPLRVVHLGVYQDSQQSLSIATGILFDQYLHPPARSRTSLEEVATASLWVKSVLSPYFAPLGKHFFLDGS